MGQNTAIVGLLLLSQTVGKLQLYKIIHHLCGLHFSSLKRLCKIDPKIRKFDTTTTQEKVTRRLGSNGQELTGNSSNQSNELKTKFCCDGRLIIMRTIKRKLRSRLLLHISKVDSAGNRNGRNGGIKL